MDGSSENPPIPARRRTDASDGRQLPLFVYGTLLPGSGIDLAERLEPIEPARVRGRLYDLGRYPALVLAGQEEAADTCGWVHGLLCAVPDEADLWARLDRYEGYDPADPDGSEYVRRRARAWSESDEWRACWVYDFSQPIDTARLLPDGRWAGRSG